MSFVPALIATTGGRRPLRDRLLRRDSIHGVEVPTFAVYSSRWSGNWSPSTDFNPTARLSPTTAVVDPGGTNGDGVGSGIGSIGAGAAGAELVGATGAGASGVDSSAADDAAVVPRSAGALAASATATAATAARQTRADRTDDRANDMPARTPTRVLGCGHRRRTGPVEFTVMAIEPQG